MRFFLLCLGILTCIYSCTDKDSIPKRVLAPAKMENVLWDMIQAERYSTTFLKRDSTKDNKLETFKLYDEVFQIHKITREQFVESYKFYLSRPDIMKTLLDSLSTMASRKRSEVYKLQKKPEIKPEIKLNTNPGIKLRTSTELKLKADSVKFKKIAK